MLRFVKQDYERLQQYLTSYSLTENLGAKAREDLLKRAHRHSLAALQVWTILDTTGRANELVLNGQKVPHDSEHLLQICEHFSDLTSTLFASLHGLYKPGLMSLRSAIETIVRGLAGLTSSEAATTTSVFRLFELAATTPPFRNDASQYFSVLSSEYAQLCAFTHTATRAHMAHNYALATFPRHDTTQLRNLTRRLERVIVAALAILIIANRQLYLLAPPRARDLLDDVVPMPVRLAALGG